MEISTGEVTNLALSGGKEVIEVPRRSSTKNVTKRKGAMGRGYRARKGRGVQFRQEVA